MPTVAEAIAADPAAAALYTSSADAGASTSAHGQMRRVASAPAFKHASCYHEASATAAVAAAAAAAAEASTSTSSSTTTIRSRLRRASQPPRIPPCSSCNGGRCSCLEVYVVSRSFTEFGGPLMKRMPPDARDRMVDMGICHYMTVFKTPDGQLVQFDFGPLGGDVQKAHGPLATLLRRARAAALQQQQLQQQEQQLQPQAAGHEGGGSISSSHARRMMHSPSAPALEALGLWPGPAAGNADAAAALVQLEQVAESSTTARRRKGVAGEIRERTLHQLPSACMYMGRTALSLDDIRQYNAAQGRMTYMLHENDCRHYVNSLVQYTTGVERSTQHLKRHYFHTRHADRWLWYGWFISASQFVTDVGNWSHIQTGAVATLLAVTGRSTLASLKTLAAPVMPALKGLPALLPAVGVAASSAAAGASGTTAAAAAAGKATMIGTLATSLKLPATLLLKRPLAAGAAAGGAGAAAAAIRIVPVPDTSAAAGGGGSGGTATPLQGGFTGAFGALGRPLRSMGDGVAHGLRSAVLGIRRVAIGNRQALRQLQPQPLLVPEPAFAVAGPGAAGDAGTAASSRGFWGSRQQPGRGWLGFRARSNSGNALVVPMGAAAAAAGTVQQRDEDLLHLQQHQRQQEQQERPGRRGMFAHIGHHVGRHVMFLGSAAARATGQLALMAFGGGRAAGPTPIVAFAGAAGGQGGLVHAASSRQLQQQQQQAGGLGRRSRSMPSLLMVRGFGQQAAAAAVSGGPTSAGAAPPAAAAPAHSTTSTTSSSNSSSGQSGMLDDLGSPAAAICVDAGLAWGSGSSSLTCSSIGGRASGVGRQVLNLPVPRISWGKRASQAMIVRQ